MNQCRTNAGISSSNDQIIINEQLEITTQHAGQIDIMQRNSVVEIPVESNDSNSQDPRKTIVGKWSKKHQSFQVLTYDSNSLK